MTGNSPGNYRWRIVALLFFATTINYLDRQVIGILKPQIADSLGWTESSFGYIVSAFQLAYAMGLLMTGRLLDRIGTKAGYSAAIVIWSLAGMGHALARSAVGFGVARFFLGIGESANFPAAIKTLAEWFPKKERALATGLFNSGANIGAIAAPILVTGITIKYGWPWAFIITGSLGFVWLIFWLLGYQLPKHQKKLSPAEFAYIHSDPEEMPGGQVPWKELLFTRKAAAICYGRLVTDWVWWFFLFWTPSFLNKVHGIDIRRMALPLIVIYTVASGGAIVGGGISSVLLKKGKSIDFARKTAILVCALCVLPIVSAPFIKNVWVVVALISLAAAAHQGWASNIFTVVSDIYPKRAVASMTGLSGFAGAIGGAVAATVVGWILQLTGSYFLIFLFAGTAYLSAWAVLKILIPRIEPVDFGTPVEKAPA
jgi:MFS transporter, ACS family, hexuronate transporter